MKRTSRFSRYLVLVGAVLGLVFPVLSIALDLYVQHLPWQIDSIRLVFIRNPIQWIVATAPVVLLGIFYSLGRIINRREHQLSRTLGKERIHVEAIKDVLKSFYRSDEAEQFGSNQLLHTLEKFKKQFREDRDREQQRNWSSEGMTKLIQLLYTTDNLEELCQNVIQFLVKYCGLAQGAMFVLVEKEDQRWLELKSRYAGDINSPLTKEVVVQIGDGMVGQCFQEGRKVVLDNVPPNYLKISSGLGKSDAVKMIILPLKNEAHIEGVLEMAGFQVLEPHVFEFLDQVADNIAGSLYNLRMNSLTRELLEESQQQAEEMRAQEEEMMQTMEELTATQEEVMRKEKEYLKRIEELELRNSDHLRREWEYKHQLAQMKTQLEEKE